MKSIFNAVMGVALVMAMACVSAPAFAKDPPVRITSVTYDASSLVDAAGETTSVTVPGAALGDACIASLSVDAVDMTITCYVQSANTVEVRVQNESGSTHDLSSATLRVFLFPKTVN